MSDALKEVSNDLDTKYQMASEILSHLRKAQKVYADRQDGVNIGRCSREHLAFLVSDLTEYVADVHKIRCALPGILSNAEPACDY